MKITLISTTSQDRITIESFPFSIGRESLSSKIIDQQSQANIRHVSKKHAQLFFNNNTFLIHDSGSLNGTYLNNQKLSERKVKIKPGDYLSLAQKLDYIIDISPHQQTTSKTSYILENTASNSSIELEHFPFFCTDDLFKHASNSDKPAGSESIQCVLSLFDGTVHIAPYRNNCQIHVDGKKIPFGHTIINLQSTISNQHSNSFILTKKTTVPTPTKIIQDNQSISPDIDSDKTVYMADATMFMSVFDADDKKKSQTLDQEKRPTENQTKSPPEKAKSIINNPLFSKIALIGILISSIVAGGLFYSHNTASYKAEKLFQQGNFEKSLVIVNNALSKKHNKKLEETGKKALIKELSPNFLESIKSQNNQEILSNLQGYQQKTQNIPDAKKILDTFAFVTKVEQVSSKSNTNQGIDDSTWKTAILSINKEWNTSSNQYQATINEIRQIEPSLTTVFDAFFSKINDCREYEIYYINKISNLEQKIKVLLEKKDYVGTQNLIEDFSEQNTKLANTELWLSDLSGFKAMSEQLENGDLFDIESVGLDYTPQTVLFKKLQSDLINTNLPSEEIRKHLLSSKQHWANGEVLEAVTALERIPPSKHQAKVDKKITFLKRIQEYQAKLNAQNTTHNCILLADLAHILKEQKTSLFEQFQPDFASCITEAKKVIPTHKQKAINAYKQFKQSGGINGQMRMESNISPAFKTKAQLLSIAFAESVFVENWATHFNIVLNSDTKAIFLDIIKEHGTQVLRIQESAILSNTTKNEKLSLLEAKEVIEWQN